MATKKDLEDKIKELKEEIRGLRKDVKETEADVGDLEHGAYGVKLVDNKFVFVTLKYSDDGKKAAIVNEKDIGNSVMVALTMSQRAIGKYVTDLNKKRK